MNFITEISLQGNKSSKSYVKLHSIQLSTRRYLDWSENISTVCNFIVDVDQSDSIVLNEKKSAARFSGCEASKMS